MKKYNDSNKGKWVVYKIMFPVGVGLITDDYDDAWEILYSEGQMYDPELWTKKDCRVFDNVRDAIKYYIEFFDEYTFDGMLRKMKNDFPEAMKKESKENT